MILAANSDSWHVTTPAALDAVLDEHQYVNPEGGGGVRWLLGPGVDRQTEPGPQWRAQLILDMDHQQQAAAVFWLGHNGNELVGRAADYRAPGPLRVWTGADIEPVPAALVGVSYDTARQVARYYMRQGARTRALDWQQVPPMESWGDA